MRRFRWFTRLTIVEEIITYVVVVPPFVLFLYQSFDFVSADPALFWSLVGGGGSAAFVLSLAARLVRTRPIRRHFASASGEGTTATPGYIPDIRRSVFNYPVFDAVIMLLRWVVFVNVIVLVPYSRIGVLDAGSIAFILAASTLNGAMSAVIAYFLAIEHTMPLRDNEQIQRARVAGERIHQDRLRFKIPLGIFVTAAYPVGFLLAFEAATALSGYTMNLSVAEAVSLSIATVILVFLVARLLGSNVKYALRKIQHALENLKAGGGDLTFRAPEVSSDTTGILARDFNSFLESIAGILQETRVSAVHMSEGSQRLQQHIEQTKTDSDGISAAVAEVAQSVNEQHERLNSAAETVAAISQAITELNAVVDDQSSGVTESSSAVTEMISNIQAVTTTVHSLGTQVQNLAQAATEGAEQSEKMSGEAAQIEEQSEALLQANQLIQGIAAQTNLLAMNAAIEAAHAGTAGRGFSVVADEIRKLAESASAQSKKIAQELKAITRTIQAVVSASRQVQDGYRKVSTFVEEVSRIEAEVRHSMDEQSAGSRETLTALTHITDLTNRMRDEFAEMVERGNSVEREMREVAERNATVATFVGSVLDGVGRISTSVQDIGELGEQNNADIQRVLESMNRFRTG